MAAHVNTIKEVLMDCNICNGYGWVACYGHPYDPPEQEPCPECDGTGRVPDLDDFANPGCQSEGHKRCIYLMYTYHRHDGFTCMLSSYRPHLINAEKFYDYFIHGDPCPYYETQEDTPF